MPAFFNALVFWTAIIAIALILALLFGFNWIH